MKATTKTKKATTKKVKVVKPKKLTSAQVNSIGHPLRKAIQACTAIIEKKETYAYKIAQIKKIRKQLMDTNDLFGWTVAMEDYGAI